MCNPFRTNTLMYSTSPTYCRTLRPTWFTRNQVIIYILAIIRNIYSNVSCSVRFHFGDSFFWSEITKPFTCKTQRETTPSGTSGNFWRRSCKTWVSIWWLPWAIRMLAGQDWLLCSVHLNISCGSKQLSFWMSRLKEKEKTVICKNI